MLCLVTQSCPTLCDPMNCSLPGSSVHGDSPGKNTGVGCHALLQGVSLTQVTNPGLPHCRQILYCLSHQGSPRIQTGVGSMSLLQGIFPTQELNWGLLHCRWILYPLSHGGSPRAFLTSQRVPCPTFLSIPTTSACHLSSLLLEQQFRTSRTSLMHMICIKILKNNTGLMWLWCCGLVAKSCPTL